MKDVENAIKSVGAGALVGALEAADHLNFAAIFGVTDPQTSGLIAGVAALIITFGIQKAQDLGGSS